MKEYTCCGVCGVCITFIINQIGGWSNALTLLSYLMIFDLIMGCLLAIVFKNSNKTVDGKLSSWEFWKGVVRKILCIMYVVVGASADRVLGTNYIRDMIIYSFVACELISLTENSILMGVPVPQVVKNFISLMKEKGDNKE